MRLLGMLGQKAYQQQRQEVQARGDAEDQACGSEVGVDRRVAGPGEGHRAEGGDARAFGFGPLSPEGFASGAKYLLKRGYR